MTVWSFFVTALTSILVKWINTIKLNCNSRLFNNNNNKEDDEDHMIQLLGFFFLFVLGCCYRRRCDDAKKVVAGRFDIIFGSVYACDSYTTATFWRVGHSATVKNAHMKNDALLQSGAPHLLNDYTVHAAVSVKYLLPISTRLKPCSVFFVCVLSLSL